MESTYRRSRVLTVGLSSPSAFLSISPLAFQLSLTPKCRIKIRENLLPHPEHLAHMWIQVPHVQWPMAQKSWMLFQDAPRLLGDLGPVLLSSPRKLFPSLWKYLEACRGKVPYKRLLIFLIGLLYFRWRRGWKRGVNLILSRGVKKNSRSWWSARWGSALPS